MRMQKKQIEIMENTATNKESINKSLLKHFSFFVTSSDRSVEKIE